MDIKNPEEKNQLLLDAGVYINLNGSSIKYISYFVS